MSVQMIVIIGRGSISVASCYVLLPADACPVCDTV